MNGHSTHCLHALTTMVMVLGLSVAPVTAQESIFGEPVSGEAMSADLVMARPVGAAATVAGFALYVVSAPFSALGGNSQEAWQSLVVAPASYTFQRPLGHFDEQPVSRNPVPTTTQGKVYTQRP